MQCIPRIEQERIINIIRQEYDIIKENAGNKTSLIAYVITQIEEFLKELTNINKDRFFEEDLRECMDGFYHNLLPYMNNNN